MKHLSLICLAIPLGPQRSCDVLDAGNIAAITIVIDSNKIADIPAGWNLLEAQYKDRDEFD